METVRGYIDAIVFAEPENGFTVARLKEPSKKELTVVVGTLPGLQPGESVECYGEWKTHPSHGRQFEVAEYVVAAPADVVGIQKYLQSGLVKGIGPKYAEKIVAKFGAETLKVIEEMPNRLLEVEGLGVKRMKALRKCWSEQKAIREVILFLRTHGASPAYAQKIFKAYGEESVRKVKENPYQIARDVSGIGFKLADAIALKLGFQMHSPDRIGAGIEHVLWELSGEGHTCYPEGPLTEAAAQVLEVAPGLVEQGVGRLVENQRLVRGEGGMVWLRPYFAYEQSIAKDLFRLLHHAQAIRAIDAAKAADWVQKQLHIEFAEQQRVAVMAALTDKVHIITGGPGTGKSTITNSILAVTSKLTERIVLAAPTGRAAKRMTQITRRKALTIHALLEMDFASGGFKRGRDNPLDCDLIVLDEASMIDTPLMYHLLRAIPSSARLLLVGDIDQLPSVGPGSVLKDVIGSGAVGVTRLTEIFRQAKGSRIVTNAHKINRGEFPDLYGPEQSDFHFIEAESPESIRQIVLQLVSKEIPGRWRFDPIEGIQVLSPMKKGVIGVEMLNEALQRLLNPSGEQIVRAGHRFQVGDKVMQIKNNYDKKVSNGDIGRIRTIDAVEQVVTVGFDEQAVEYEFSELDELTLAYAASIHKYQGSECPCVVMPIHTTHFKMLHRNLLYTGVTRGKKQVYLVGTKKAVAIAVQNDQVQKRYTGLEGALKKAAEEVALRSHQLKFF